MSSTESSSSADSLSSLRSRSRCSFSFTVVHEILQLLARLEERNLLGGNLHTVAGFSGHGMMHAPAAGRAIAELLLKGSFQTIDLTRFGYERVETNEPCAETGIV